ncbi:RHS repeat domain-containing protein [Photorhabdus temperata]|uniref:RHS repeat domain-containing protein n=1 Tax=Photorhabdus temperata TaxID=574560 RepID=UPI0026C9D8EB
MIFRLCPSRHSIVRQGCAGVTAMTPSARYEKGQLYYVVSDHQGTVREILTEDGELIWAGRLLTWGEAECWRVLTRNDERNLTCNLRFCGQYEDEESGLFYNRHRYYERETGQYLSTDPLNLSGGFNPYGYVHDPVNWIDPLGLAGKDCGNIKQGVLDNIAASKAARESSHFGGNAPNPKDRTLEGFMKLHVSPDRETLLFTQSSGFNNNKGKVGGQFKRYGLDSHAGISPHVHQPVRNVSPKTGDIYGSQGTKTSDGGVTSPSTKDIKQLYDHVYNGKYNQ